MIVADGVHWANGATAIGTIAVAVAAVGVAIMSQRHSDAVITEERHLADKRLAEQMQHSDVQLTAERDAADARLRAQLEHSDERLREERQQATDREKLAQAYAVMVIGAMAHDPEVDVDRPAYPKGKARLRTASNPAVIIVNHGDYPITKIDAKFGAADSAPETYLSSHSAGPPYVGLDQTLTYGLALPMSSFWRRSNDLRLTPTEPGLRLDGDSLAPAANPYVIVRWTDHWGTRWEHQDGQVRQVTEDQPWTPLRSV